MKKYESSDYAANKNAKGIVYRFADEITEISLADYLAENPGKTEEDFLALKALSDADYLETDRDDYRKTWKNLSIHSMEDSTNFGGDTLEDEVIEHPEREAEEIHRRKLALAALDKLTEVQRRRYLLYHAKGLTEWQIAETEGTTQQAVSKTLYWAEKKIKKFLTEAKK